MKFVDSMRAARAHGIVLAKKGLMVDSEELLAISFNLRSHSASKVELACHTLVREYDCQTAKRILEGFEL